VSQTINFRFVPNLRGGVAVDLHAPTWTPPRPASQTPARPWETN